MTDYSKTTIQDIWEKRKLNCFSMVNSERELDTQGNGIFLNTLSGNTLFDLRPASERLFLGHLHPLLVKAQQTREKINIKTSNRLPEFLKDKDKVEVTLADILVNRDLSTYPGQAIVIENDLSLLATDGFFHFSKDQFKRRVIYSKPLGVYAWEEESLEPSFEASLLHQTQILMDTFFHPIPKGKNQRDIALLKNLESQYPQHIKVLGRHLIMDAKLSNSLTDEGILHGLIENYSVLGYPLACTEQEITSSFKIIQGVIEGD